MPESSFEQKIQEKLDELRLRPSAQVWADVESRIRKEKRRRRMILWLPLFTLLLGGGLATAWFMNPEKKSPLTRDQQTMVPEQEQPGAGYPSVTVVEENKKQYQPASATTEKQKPAPATVIKTKSTDGASFRNTVSKPSPSAASAVVHSHAKAVFRTQTAAIKTKPGKTNPGGNAEPGQTLMAGNIHTIAVQQPVKKNEPVSNKPETGDGSVSVRPSVAGNPESTPDQTMATGKSDTVETNAKPVISLSQPEPVPAIAENPVAMVKPQPPFRRRIEWGIRFTPSFSQISDAILNVPLGEQKSNVQVANLNGPPFSPALPAANGISNSLYDMGFSYQVGVFAQKDIFKRSRIRAGLNYARYTTSIQGGSLISNSVSVINDFGNYTSNGISYRRGVQQPYKTRFSYIEMPLTYQLRIGKGKNVPLWMHGSLVPGLLTASNMLHYDSTVAGFYFVDNRRLNQVLLSYETGLSVEFGKKSKFPVTVGPQLRLGLSNLLKKEYGQRYILSGGLNITVRKRAQ